MEKHMKQLLVPVGVALAAVLAACGGGYGGGGSTYTPPGSPSGSTPAPLGAMTIGFALPSGAIGTVNTPFGVIGGYTQNTYSQVIAFPPGTKVTLKNLSSGTAHTLNVLSMSGFPSSPSLDSSASGGTTLSAGYRSGTIAGGSTATLTLANAGTYYIGCAFHYMQTPSMRGVIEVSANATPGPQATPPPSSGGSGGAGGGY
jgi:plastocyanin